MIQTLLPRDEAPSIRDKRYSSLRRFQDESEIVRCHLQVSHFACTSSIVAEKELSNSDINLRCKF